MNGESNTKQVTDAKPARTGWGSVTVQERQTQISEQEASRLAALNPEEREIDAKLRVHEDETAIMDGVVTERGKAIEGVYKGLVEVNELFKDFGIKVVEQGENIVEIAANIGSARERTIAGNLNIRKAAHYQKGGSALDANFPTRLDVDPSDTHDPIIPIGGERNSKALSSQGSSIGKVKKEKWGFPVLTALGLREKRPRPDNK